MRAAFLLLGAWLVVEGGDASADGGVKLSAEELALTRDADRADYPVSHWAGFFSTAALREPLARPSPPYLLVCNHPGNRESKNQNVVEEIVRWEPDGSLVSTGLISTSAPGRSTAFRAASKLLLENPPK